MDVGCNSWLGTASITCPEEWSGAYANSVYSGYPWFRRGGHAGDTAGAGAESVTITGGGAGTFYGARYIVRGFPRRFAKIVECGTLRAMRWLKNLKLSELTTMRIGGEAHNVVEVNDEKDVRQAYQWAREQGKSVFVLGSGSNVIASDEGYHGLVILNRIKDGLVEENGVFTVPSGMILDEFVEKVSDEGWSGMEAMAKIPGTIGAAPVQNAGAYGQEIKDVCVKVRCFDSFADEFVEIEAEKCGFGYRRSIFNTTDNWRYFIVSVTVKLRKAHLEAPFYNSLQMYLDERGVTDYTPRVIFEAVSAVRAAKLPDPTVEPSAGSFFKNIQVSDEEAARLKATGVMVWDESDGGRNVVPSGWLIENAGLKGKEFFGFQVSEKAALILINRSAKYHADLVKARNAIADAVYKKYGLILEQEPVEIK